MSTGQPIPPPWAYEQIEHDKQTVQQAVDRVAQNAYARGYSEGFGDAKKYLIERLAMYAKESVVALALKELLESEGVE